MNRVSLTQHPSWLPKIYLLKEMTLTMTETIPYEITDKAGEIEFRMYPSVVLATVDSEWE
jgi:hypothetical protein